MATVRKFKLLRGNFYQLEVDPATKQQVKVKYSASDPQKSIVSSHDDLETKFGREKFQCLDRFLTGIGAGDDALRQQLEDLRRENEALKAQISGSTPTPDGDDLEKNLQSMSVKELRKYAEQEGIDLGTASNKDEIVHTILSEALAR